MKKVAVAISGGVDSATTAHLLKQQGYDCFGVTMVLFENPNFLEDAKKVCKELEIPHIVIDLSKEFEQEVQAYFLSEYEKGRTPNPCVRCNRFIKFGRFIEEAFKLGADYFATGHYVKKIDNQIYISDNEQKDQSYFLAQIKREYLPKILFPLYQHEKESTRHIAKEIGLSVHNKKDSQEVCFIENSYKEFLAEHSRKNICGNIVHINGTILKAHHGIYNFTIGQRKGLGIAAENPLYVISINGSTGDVVVGSNDDLMTKRLVCGDINSFVEDLSVYDNETLYIKIRSRDNLHTGKIHYIDKNSIEVVFDSAVRAVTPGQIAAFYTKEHLLLGSGWIK